MDDLNAFERTVAYELSLMSGPHSNVDAAGIAAAVGAASPKRPSGRGRLIKIVLAVGIVAVFVALTVVIIGSLGGEPDAGGSDRPAALETPDPDATATPPPPTPEPTIAGVALTTPRTWARTGLPASERADDTAMAIGPGGRMLVVAGATEVNDRPHGWLSGNGGASWTQTNLGLRRRESVLPTSVLGSETGFIVVGHGDEGAIVQTSPDGLEWSRLATLPDAQFLDIQAGEDGFIARGVELSGRNRDRRHHPALFTSTDGEQWSMQRIAQVGTEPREALPDDLITLDLARSDDGITLITGRHRRGGVEGLIVDPATSGASRAASELYWRSTDGVSWTPLKLPSDPEAPGTDADPVRVTALTWTPRGFFMATQVPAGERSIREGGIWHSEDGVIWQKVGDAGNAFVGEFASGGPDLLAFTTPVAERNSDGVWLLVNTLDPELSSSDGLNWETWQDPAFSRFEVTQALVTDDGAIVALGYERIPGEPERKVAPVWQLLTGASTSP